MKKVVTIIITFLFASLLFSNIAIVYADEVGLRIYFEETKVLDDLRESVLSDGTKFDLSTYPSNLTASCILFTVVGSIGLCVGLYIYTYNPNTSLKLVFNGV